MKPIRSFEICIDVVDAVPVAAFWSALLGYETTDEPGGRWVELAAQPASASMAPR